MCFISRNLKTWLNRLGTQGSEP